MAGDLVERLRSGNIDEQAACAEEAADRIAALEAEVAAWRELAERGVSLVEDACKDTNWGQPTFGPDWGEELRAEFDRITTLERTTHD